jgi:S1-C subfamily serine protease
MSYFKVLFLISLFIFGCGMSKYNTEVRSMVSHTLTIEANLGIWRAVGTGVAIEKDYKKYVLTARHVAEIANEVSIRACSVERPNQCIPLDINDFEGILTPKYTIDDWAAMPIRKLPKGTSPARIGPRPKIGDQIWVIGSPLGIPGEITQGIISNITESGYSIDARALPGNSGGPVYNHDQEVIAIVIGIANTPFGVIETSGLAIPIPLKYL